MALAAPAYRADDVRIEPPQSLAALAAPPAMPEGDGVTVQIADDGSTIVQFNPPQEQNDNEPSGKDFYHNLAEDIDESSLMSLGQQVLDGIKADEDSRNDWVDNYTQGLPMLGLKIEAGSKGGPKSKTSTVKHPLLLDSCVTFQARARGEMLPASGPCKVRNDGEESQPRNKLADLLERDMNHYLTVTATEYYPDTDRALFYLGYGGTIYKKVYRCPLRQRPVSEAVYLPDLIVSQDATDLINATRVTHQISSSQNDVKMMMLAGQYIETELSQPVSQPNKVQEAQANLTGIKASAERPEDEQRTLYETYVRLDLTDYGINEDGKPDGVALPYKITIDRDSRKVLELRRNWKQNDANFTQRRWFVKYELIPGMGFLGIGFVHLLGNYTLALTALMRLIIDAGMFANFPAGVRVKGLRLDNNEINPAPGEFPEMDTNGLPIQSAIMSLPFKGPSAEILALFQAVETAGEKMAGTVDIETGDGRTNVPVGTIMAQIEQQTQVMTAVHKRMHAAQQTELELMKALFAEEPGALGIGNPKAYKWTRQDLDDLTLVPASDPNVPAHVHRLMIGTALEQLASAHPEMYNQYEVQKRLLSLMNVSDQDSILIPPQVLAAASGQQGQGQQDPATAALTLQAQSDMASTQQKAQQAALTHQQKMTDFQLRLKEHMDDMAQQAADRESKEKIAEMNAQVQLILKGIEALGQPQTSPDPLRDQRAGP